ncbi:YigZ family protein [Aurantibacter crassamenti]|uniref:IMPACT family protein n=1 Tax=Aurantibacter crassamenti TaxID=1837375 RepID=UPI001939EEC1|nr:YigZ family protein [Aurantibacter crassamenti]MBM1107517.1 YigZ family protein [Aurantibacter crassamenti]
MSTTTTKYKTILKPSEEILYKDKKSKFYGYTFPIQSEDEVKPIIESLRKKHHTANHVCYAWQLGIDDIRYRANDDGEPNNSAGMPIYGQIQSFEVTNILVAVARIFGGTKLGVGGLISAYRETAKIAIQESKIVERKLLNHYKIQFEYSEMNQVMAFIKKLQLEISSQKMDNKCEICFSIERENENQMLKQIASLHKIKVSKLD